jgi:hypothetical protein
MIRKCAEAMRVNSYSDSVNYLPRISGSTYCPSVCTTRKTTDTGMHGSTAVTLVINNVYVPATQGWLETELSSARLVAEFELTGRYPSRAGDKRGQRVTERYRRPDRSWCLAALALYR